MAYTTHSTPYAPRLSLISLGTGFIDWLVRVGERHSRADQVAALRALSDLQLAERGLTRDKIELHVFRDKLAL